MTVDERAPVRSKPWPSWPIWDEPERANLLAVLDSGNWGGDLARGMADSSMVAAFEAAWSAVAGVSHTVTCSNGSTSLEVALAALDVRAGDEVIVPPYTFAATTTAVLAINALPVFVDIDPATSCVDPRAVEEAISPRTAAVIAVHLTGHPADMDALAAIAGRHGLALIEDAAQAHGATWSGRPVGGIGNVGCWSFQSSKNLTSGEGGAVTTNDQELAEIVASLCNCGRIAGGAGYEHHRRGNNFRLTQWQAAVLLAGLSRMPEQIERREASAAWLDKELAAIEGIRPLRRDPRVTVHAHHLYAFRYEPAVFDGLPRSAFVDKLNREGIPASSGYPVPLYRQPLFTNRAFDVKATGWTPGYAPTRYEALSLPACEAACSEIVWLPQRLLLAPVEEMSDVLEAIVRIQSEAQQAK